MLHLGCTLENDNSMKTDIAMKRGRFIGKIHSIMQEFHFAKEEVLIKLLNTYTTSFYGSPLWDPLSNSCEKIYRSWNVTMRNTLNVDRTTHRYLIEPLSDSLHPKIMLISRMIGFYKSQLVSPKLSIRFLVNVAANDMTTALGRTLHYAVQECGIKDNDFQRLTPALIKKKMKYMEAPTDVQWRVDLACELRRLRDADLVLENFSYEEIEELLLFACTT